MSLFTVCHRCLAARWLCSLRTRVRGPRCYASRLGVLTLVAVGVTAGCPLQAAEPAEDFLRELKSRGYYDLALEYLDRLEHLDTVDEDVRRTIDFQQGEVLIQAALQQRILSRKQDDLDRAQHEFEEFVREQADHPLALSARGRLGDIAMERARLLVSQATQPTVTTEQAEGLRAEAHEQFYQSAEVFEQHKAKLRGRLEQIPKALSAEKDAALIKERDLLRSEYVQCQFVAAMALYEEALTYDASCDEREPLLQRAEVAFKSVAEKYRRRVAGLSAGLFLGRCRQLAQDPRRGAGLLRGPVDAAGRRAGAASAQDKGAVRRDGVLFGSLCRPVRSRPTARRSLATATAAD